MQIHKVPCLASIRPILSVFEVDGWGRKRRNRVKDVKGASTWFWSQGVVVEIHGLIPWVNTDQSRSKNFPWCRPNPSGVAVGFWSWCIMGTIRQDSWLCSSQLWPYKFVCGTRGTGILNPKNKITNFSAQDENKRVGVKPIRTCFESNHVPHNEMPSFYDCRIMSVLWRILAEKMDERKIREAILVVKNLVACFKLVEKGSRHTLQTSLAARQPLTPLARTAINEASAKMRREVMIWWC